MGSGGVQIGYVRPVQFLDHLTVIIMLKWMVGGRAVNWLNGELE